MDDLEKQLMDLSGIKEPEQTAAPKLPSVLKDADYGHASHIAPVRTFSTDLADAVRTHGGSVVRVAIAEEEKHRREYEDTSIKSKKNITLIVVSIILLAAGAAAVAWAYWHKEQASVVAPVVTAAPESLVASDLYETIDSTGMQAVDLYGAIRKIVDEPRIQEGQIANIVIVKSVGNAPTRPGISEFLTALGTHAPDELVRALKTDFMLGTYLYGGRDNLFLVVHGTAHDYLLSGMLKWEPYLFADMVSLFAIDTHTLTKNQIETMTFAPAIIANQDARAALGADGKPLLYYAFLNQNTIIIATDSKTLIQAIAKFKG